VVDEDNTTIVHMVNALLAAHDLVEHHEIWAKSFVNILLITSNFIDAVKKVEEY